MAHVATAALAPRMTTLDRHIDSVTTQSGRTFAFALSSITVVCRLHRNCCHCYHYDPARYRFRASPTIYLMPILLEWPCSAVLPLLRSCTAVLPPLRSAVLPLQRHCRFYDVVAVLPLLRFWHTPGVVAACELSIAAAALTLLAVPTYQPERCICCFCALHMLLACQVPSTSPNRRPQAKPKSKW